MFKPEQLIPRAKLTAPQWVLYKDEKDYIGRIGTGAPKNADLPYKPWSDPTIPRSAPRDFFSPPVDAASTDSIRYWSIGKKLLSVDNPRVKYFYRELEAWRAYETIVEHRFVFYQGVPWLEKFYVPRAQCLAANFARGSKVGFVGFPQKFPHPVKLNVSRGPVILLPSYVSGVNGLTGIEYQDFIRSISQFNPIAEKLQVIDSIIHNPAYVGKDAEKMSAIRKVCTMPDDAPWDGAEGKVGKAKYVHGVWTDGKPLEESEAEDAAQG